MILQKCPDGWFHSFMLQRQKVHFEIQKIFRTFGSHAEHNKSEEDVAVKDLKSKVERKMKTFVPHYILTGTINV
ncbi:hypothetical protein RRG08_055519 [Elysia crispata]|uniref:Uncharacterized protein n=1 Tax=Elysia crispata TaxID=231223 RepID=A0AAE1AP84_9GAST|nr:hypothetical protein RRG08_055519 [Elysia crispata]